MTTVKINLMTPLGCLRTSVPQTKIACLLVNKRKSIISPFYLRNRPQTEDFRGGIVQSQQWPRDVTRQGAPDGEFDDLGTRYKGSGSRGPPLLCLEAPEQLPVPRPLLSLSLFLLPLSWRFSIPVCLILFFSFFFAFFLSFLPPPFFPFFLLFFFSFYLPSCLPSSIQ